VRPREPFGGDGEERGVHESSDAEVIAASRREPARFGEIFDRHATTLRRYLVRRLGPDDGDAILGDVFRIAFERRDTYDTDRPLATPWLYGIATNLVARHRRSEARRLRAVARLATRRLDSGDVADAVGRAVDAAADWQRVAETVTRLPETERDVLVLAVWEDLTYEQIADALDIPIGTVRSRLNRARTRLRELDRFTGEEQDEHLDPDGTARRTRGRIGS
jgi:RNA polymerase sigma-70 factor (ECF subfamily)